MEHSYKPLSTNEALAEHDHDVETDGLFETSFDQYEETGRMRRVSRDSRRSSSVSTARVSTPTPPSPPSSPLPDAPSRRPTANLLTIPTIPERIREPVRTSPPKLQFERCVTPTTVQNLLQHDFTLDHTRTRTDSGGRLSDHWRGSSEGVPPATRLPCWQRFRRPLARAIGIFTAVVVSGCAGEMIAMGERWRGALAAAAATAALALDALWAAELLAAAAAGGAPSPALAAVRRAARRARTPFYAVVALLLVAEGVGALRWAAAALAAAAAAMRAAAWCGPRAPRSRPLLTRDGSFALPAVHYDAEFAQREEIRSATPSRTIFLSTPLNSTPGTPMGGRRLPADTCSSTAPLPQGRSLSSQSSHPPLSPSPPPLLQL